ncbi:MAG: class I SAM-dependent methyltransferase [Candidatus Omnitrophota bacterium]
MKTKNDWCFRFFNNPDYLDIYRDMTSPSRTHQELRMCEEVLKWREGEPILDAPCGAGRHSLDLARQGHLVYGVDISNYLLGIAQKESINLTVQYPPRFVRGLMQALPFKDCYFQYAICLFSSFGYGENEKENLAVLEEFARVLYPGGKALIDVMNRHYLTPRLKKVYESVQSGLRVREERTITDNERRLHNSIMVCDPQGHKRRYLYNPWLFNGFELSWLVSRAGLKVEAIYGNFRAETYTPQSERAIVVAVKPV